MDAFYVSGTNAMIDATRETVMWPGAAHALGNQLMKRAHSA
jgi:hypothetical protein